MKGVERAGSADESRLGGSSLDCFSEQTHVFAPHLDVKDSSAQMTRAVGHEKQPSLSLHSDLHDTWRQCFFFHIE